MNIHELDPIVDRLYPEGGAHARDHAKRVAELSLQISQLPDYFDRITDEDRLLIYAAALGHDSGYPKGREYWSGIQFEHVFESVHLTRDALSQIPWFNEDPARLRIVELLVLNHDNTNYTFPAWERTEENRRGYRNPGYGRPELLPSAVIKLPNVPYVEQEFLWSEHFQLMLSVLQEADSRLGSVKRTLEFSASRGIPLADGHNGVFGIGMPMWQYTGAANTLLAANRAILDAQTREGQELALNLFRETRDVIRDTVKAQSAEYVTYMTEHGAGVHLEDNDNVGELLREEDIRRLIFSRPKLERWRNQFPLVYIQAAYPLSGLWQLPKEYRRDDAHLVSALIDVADISVDGVEYKLQELEQDESTREGLISNYALDFLTEIPGALSVAVDHSSVFHVGQPVSRILLPPEVRVDLTDFQELSSIQPPYCVTRGAELVHLAREVGLKRMRVIFNRNPSF